MESEIRTTTATTTADSGVQFYFDYYARDDSAGGGDALAEKRLNDLLAANRETDARKKMFRSRRERDEAESMRRPVAMEQAFARFGALLGVFPPAAIFARLFFDKQFFRLENIWMLGIVGVVSLIAATVGYCSGKSVGKIVQQLERKSWARMILALPFVGAAWGIIAGGAGAIIIFVFGAFFGALVGGAVGAAALPVFAVLHRLVKRGDRIEEKHFLPLAYGVAWMISAFIIGL